MGSTTKGIFIKSASKWIIFLSFGEFRSPLTVTFDNDVSPLHRLEKGMPILVESTRIIIPEVNIVIPIDTVDIWQVPPAPFPINNFAHHGDLAFMVNEILDETQKSGLRAVFPFLLDQEYLSKDSKQPQFHLWSEITNIQNGLWEREYSRVIESIAGILGKGEGLTPMGDDFIIGLYLCLNRWKKMILPDEELKPLNEQIVDIAYEKTTTLSANLIECASKGLADERLIHAADYLMGAENQKREVITDLLNWGSSSGYLAFIGILVAISIWVRN